MLVATAAMPSQTLSNARFGCAGGRRNIVMHHQPRSHHVSPLDIPSAGADVPPQQDRLVDAMVLALAKVAEPGEAGGHIGRIQCYVETLLRRLCRSGPFASQWPDALRAALVGASALHDIGNSAIPDRILLKPGRLLPEELQLVRSHTTRGRDILLQLQRNAGEPSVLLELAQQIAQGHHERWDGHGYPFGLAGQAIAAPALLVAVADAYDALTSDRVYRAGVAHDKAMQVLFQERGGQFAPDMIDALVEVEREFADIARRHADSETELQRRIDYLAQAIAESP